MIGTAVGDIGTILRTTNGGLTYVKPTRMGDAPSQFVLEQNYPNPFNSSTIISFSMPLGSFVSLKVFDLLGREVGIIVSGEMPAGNYSRQWNSTNISSGIYFYRLQTDTYSETKKLVLLK